MSLEFVIKFINIEFKKVFEDRLNKYGDYITEKKMGKIKLKAPNATHNWDNDVTLLFNNEDEIINLIVNSKNIEVYSILSKCLDDLKFEIFDEDGDIFLLKIIFAVN